MVDPSSSPANGIAAASPSVPSECQTIEQMLHDGLFNVVTWLQILLILAIFPLVILFFCQYSRTRVPFHRNLLLLIFNLILFYLIYSLFWIVFQLRYKYLLLTYKQSCELLTPVWLAALLTAPSYFQLVANTGIHFAIMLERVRATLFVGNYEREGLKYGILGMAIVWSLSLAYTIYIILSALADSDGFNKPLGLVALTSKYNKQLQIYSYYATLSISILTIIGDCWVMLMNRKIKKNMKNAAYSLSQNYQLRENQLSMRLILPLDASYVLLFCVYVLTGFILRQNLEQLGTLRYTAYYYIAQMLPMLHSAMTLIIYIWFMKRIARIAAANLEPLNGQAHIHFKQLQQQWNL